MPKCGAAWKKPVNAITDRQKRHRANHPDCKPSGPKVCFKCGSRRFVTVDHKDGDESNGKPSNLRYACKAHNTSLGMAMAKAGKGVRTRQYNPSTKLRVAIKAYDDALWVLGQHRATGSPPKTIQKAEKRVKDAKRWLESAEREEVQTLRRKNPGATNLAQYVQAAVDHTRGSHDAGGKVIHETPKGKRREFAREIAFRKGYRNNPSPADELYKAFHGRGPDKITTMLVAGIDPYGGHPELTSLGPLVRLVVGEEVELSDDGEVESADWVNEILFVPSMREYRSITERLDPKDNDDLRKFKGWLKSIGAPDVAAVPNTRQLYFVGGNQNLDEQLVSLGADPEKDLADLGFVYLIEYFAQKRFDRFEPTTYFHQFGEKSGVRPRLVYLRVPKLLLLSGGEYVVRSVGIDN